MAMTKRDFLTAVSNGELNDEVMEFAANEIVKLDTRNANRKASPKELEKQAENEALKAAIVEHIGANGAKTATELAADLEMSSHQKAANLCRQLVKAGVITKQTSNREGRAVFEYILVD